MPKPIQDKQFEEEVLSVDRVTRVVAGGRRMRFRAVVVVGDRNGKIALGTGKANEVNSAVQKATRQAKKNMIRVPIWNGTIPHETRVSYKSAHVDLFPARSGTGIIAGSVIRKMLALAGYRNILSKMHGSSNKLLNAQALIAALKTMKPRKDTPVTQKEGEPAPLDDRAPRGRASISSRPEAKKEGGDERGGRGGRPGGRNAGRGGPRRDGGRGGRRDDMPSSSPVAETPAPAPAPVEAPSEPAFQTPAAE